MAALQANLAAATEIGALASMGCTKAMAAAS